MRQLIIALLFFLFHIYFVTGVLKKLPSADGNLNIYALPVGQGDCTVIQCPTGNEISIFDAGTRKSTGFTPSDLTTFIAGQTINKIILSHPDTDHTSYVTNIFDQLRSTKLAFPDVYHSCNWNMYNIKDKDVTSKEQQIPSCIGNTCPQYKICSGTVTIQIVASEYIACTTDKNGASVVAVIMHNTARYLLLTGDFETKSQDAMNDFIAQVNINTQIYKLSHHGAYNNGPGKFTNTDIFLDAIEAKYIFSSAGAKGNYKHPRCELYRYYEDPAHQAASPVAQHQYQCYESMGYQNPFPTNLAIYITTLHDQAKNVYTNSYVKFAINLNTNAIDSSLVFFNSFSPSGDIHVTDEL